MLLAEKLLAASGGGGGNWAFVAAGAVASGSNPTVALPAGWAQNDSLLIIVTAGGDAGMSTPSGWTADVNISTSPKQYIYRRTAGASESNVSLNGGGSHTVAVMVAYRKLAASPVDVVGTQNAVTGTSNTTNSLTTTTANDLLISVYDTPSNCGTFSAPAGTTVRVQSDSTASLRGLLVVDENKDSAGASTPRTATWVTSGPSCGAVAISYKGV